MKVVITGGTGFLGRALARGLVADGHQVVVLTRGAQPAGQAALRLVQWVPEREAGPWRLELEGADVAVNLAGESIAGRRWSEEQKGRILESRLQATRSLVDAIAATGRRPRVLVSASAVGYYGPLADQIVTEAHPAGGDFLATVCRQWESEAVRASANTRVVCIRTGLVLAKDGGALPRMLLPFKLGAGGRLGTGRQYWPWIHRADWLSLVRWMIDTPAASGPFNATAPTPVTNTEFTQALARALRRPALLPAPAFALRLALGEMADALLLAGQRAVPARAQQLGFTFQNTNLDEALSEIVA